jgi:hypothetical protein
MRQVIAFKAQGKGGFAFHKDFKVKKGTSIDVTRFPQNIHG